jgi:hypothetical protein
VLEDFLNQPVKLFLRLKLRRQNFRPGILGWPVEALIEVGDSYFYFIATSRILKIKSKINMNSKKIPSRLNKEGH